MSALLHFPSAALEKLLPIAFEEDLGPGDITSTATISENSMATSVLIAKGSGMVAGLPLVEQIFKYKNFKGVFTNSWQM